MVTATRFGAVHPTTLGELLAGPAIVDPAGNPVRALCRDADPDMFFSENARQQEAARAICRRCPGAASCLSAGVGETYGVWGGFTRLAARGRPPASMERRRDLYAQGLSDFDIANELGLAESTIKEWRTKEKLPSNFTPVRTTPLTAEQQAFRQDLYEKGFNDGDIARAEGVSVTAVQSWRRNRKLPANQVPGRPVRPDADTLRDAS